MRECHILTSTVIDMAVPYTLDNIPWTNLYILTEEYNIRRVGVNLIQYLNVLMYYTDHPYLIYHFPTFDKKNIYNCLPLEL